MATAAQETSGILPEPVDEGCCDACTSAAPVVRVPLSLTEAVPRSAGRQRVSLPLVGSDKDACCDDG
ncbi:hypothetical protein ACFWY6_03445 [Streptomyces sp. NPDC059037]|uniref:hypothetical protein n=1 Tax=Streptomyces sp. NPDC059037 TaxID=3346710 RepID=UPI0036C6506D